MVDDFSNTIMSHFMDAIIFSVYLVLFCFPLMLIYIQWRQIKRRLPWVGMMVNLIFILILALIGFAISKAPKDCIPLVNCQWDMLGLIITEGYTILTGLISLGVSLGINFGYRRWIWKEGETIRSTGKTSSFLLIGAIFLLMVNFGAIVHYYWAH
jgi:hypothetical protein